MQKKFAVWCVSCDEFNTYINIPHEVMTVAEFIETIKKEHDAIGNCDAPQISSELFVSEDNLNA